MESTAEVTTLRTDPRYIAQFNAALTRFQRHMELHANDAPFEDITSDDEDDEERNQCRFLTPVSLDDQDVTSYQSLQNHHGKFRSPSTSFFLANESGDRAIYFFMHTTNAHYSSGENAKFQVDSKKIQKSKHWNMS